MYHSSEIKRFMLDEIVQNYYQIWHILGISSYYFVFQKNIANFEAFLWSFLSSTKPEIVRGDERSGELYFFILPMEAERGRSGRDLKASSILSRVFSSFLVSTGLERGLLLLSIGPIWIGLPKNKEIGVQKKSIHK